MTSTCVAFSDWYRAALFYDYVIPLPLPPSREEFELMASQVDFIKEAFHPGVSSWSYFSWVTMNARASPLYPEVFLIENPQNFEEKDKSSQTRSEMLLLIRSREAFIDSHLSLPKKIISHLESAGETVDYFGLSPFDAEVDIEKVMLTISNISVIDSKSLKWEVVREFRKDKASLSKLRRLRAFAIKDYTGKPRSFIEDDILTRVEDHEDATKKWGLETIKSTISAGASEKIILAGLGGLLATTSGAPISTTVAIGASALLGSTLVQLVSGRKLLELSQTKDPIRYIYELRQATRT